MGVYLPNIIFLVWSIMEYPIFQISGIQISDNPDSPSTNFSFIDLLANLGDHILKQTHF